MISKVEALKYLERIAANRPLKIVDKVAEADKGMWAVMFFIERQNGKTYANLIADGLDISRARAGVLVDKLEGRGYIEKQSSSGDGRIVTIVLTDDGKVALKKVKEDIAEKIMRIVDEIGQEEFENFIEISYKIETIFKNAK